MARRAGEFFFVKACDKKTQEAVKARGAGEVIILDPDGAELYRGGVANPAGVEAAMESALKKYSDRPIAWEALDAKALDEAKASGKLALVAFYDPARDEAALKMLEDRTLVRLHDSFRFLRVEFKRDSEAAKAWGVTSSPTLLAVDPRKDPGAKAVLETVTGKKPPLQLRALLQKAVSRSRASAGRS